MGTPHVIAPGQPEMLRRPEDGAVNSPKKGKLAQVFATKRIKHLVIPSAF